MTTTKTTTKKRNGNQSGNIIRLRNEGTIHPFSLTVRKTCSTDPKNSDGGGKNKILDSRAAMPGTATQ